VHCTISTCIHTNSCCGRLLRILTQLALRALTCCYYEQLYHNYCYTFTTAAAAATATADATTNRDRLRDFQFKMMELQELFRDEAKSEFVVVTIASVLAVAESERLVKQLREQEVPVRHMVVSYISISL
jgi:Anion-transporting ATPase